MPDWNVDELMLFLLFFMPGFVSIKVYDLIVAGERRDFSKSLLEAVGYSCLNFAALSWLIVIIHSNAFGTQHRFWYFLFLFLIVFVVPVLWPVLFVKLSSWRRVARHVVHPIPRPWDYVFRRRRRYWVIVHLADGRRIGGKFGAGSFASSYPSQEQIYLEEAWVLNEEGGFEKRVERTEGVIILGKDVIAVELFSWDTGGVTHVKG